MNGNNCYLLAASLLFFVTATTRRRDVCVLRTPYVVLRRAHLAQPNESSRRRAVAVTKHLALAKSKNPCFSLTYAAVANFLCHKKYEANNKPIKISIKNTLGWGPSTLSKEKKAPTKSKNKPA